MHIILPLLLASTAAAAGGFYPHDPNVKSITTANFPTLVEKNPKSVLVEFYSPGCGHCVQLKDTWKAIAAELTPHIIVGAVNCATDQQLCGQYQIRGVPSIKLFTRDAKNKLIVMDYNEGDRKKQSIVNFAKRLAPSHVLKVSEVKRGDEYLTLDKFLEKDPKIAKVLLVKADTMAPTLAFKTISVEFKGKLLVGITNASVDKKLLGKIDSVELDAGKDAVILFAPGSKKGIVYNGKLGFTPLRSFLDDMVKAVKEDRIEAFLNMAQEKSEL